MRKLHMKNKLTTTERICCFTALIAIVTSAMVSCNKLPFLNSQFTEVVYIESNNYMKSQNAIIAYRNNGDGKLITVLGGPFFTGGSGVANTNQILGPNDSDNEIMITNDKKFLLAVNSGSNTIAVFKINLDGTLSMVPGSPFPSGGETPVSIGMWQQYVYVVNKSNNPLQASTMKPNYTVFMLQGDGSLTPVANSTVETAAGSSPSQILVSRTHAFAFGSDFLGFQLTPAQGTLRSFTETNTGLLLPVSGTPQAIPGGGGALGLCQHPSKDILYVGFPTQSKVGVYNINSTTGALTYASSVQANTAACWIKTNTAGDRMYVLNSGVNSVGVYNTSNPLQPGAMMELKLKNSGPTFSAGGTMVTSSQAFSIGSSMDGKHMYVVSQHANPDFTIGNYNFLHVLWMSDLGLAEPDEPMQLPVDNHIRPRGLAVFRIN